MSTEIKQTCKGAVCLKYRIAGDWHFCEDRIKTETGTTGNCKTEDKRYV